MVIITLKPVRFIIGCAPLVFHGIPVSKIPVDSGKLSCTFFEFLEVNFKAFPVKSGPFCRPIFLSLMVTYICCFFHCAFRWIRRWMRVVFHIFVCVSLTTARDQSPPQKENRYFFLRVSELKLLFFASHQPAIRSFFSVNNLSTTPIKDTSWEAMNGLLSRCNTCFLLVLADTI